MTRLASNLFGTFDQLAGLALKVVAAADEITARCGGTPQPCRKEA